MNIFTSRLTKLAALLIVFFLYHAVTAQVYFAGTGAGAGNTGSAVTGVGYAALGSGNSGGAMAAFGSYALFSNTSGTNNTAVGHVALYSNLSGKYNTAMGNAALYRNTTSTDNTAIGFNTLFSNTASYNTALGSNALTNTTVGERNTALGAFALENNINGVLNTAVGSFCMLGNTSGSGNTAVGNVALNHNSTGAANTAVGYNALPSNTTGFGNTAVGDSSMGNSASSNYNTGIGHRALLGNAAGSGNTAVGSYSLNTNPNGYSNTAMGFYSMSSNTSGNRNIALGDSALLKNATGNSNVASGFWALGGNTTGSVNTAIGDHAFYQQTTGNANVAIGGSAGSSLTSYSFATLIGYKTDVTSLKFTNTTAIGYAAMVDASNKVVVGNTAVVSIGGQVGWTTFSDQRLKTNISKSKLGLDFIMLLNPVTYNYKAAGQKDILYNGLIAQEVAAAAEKLNIPFSGVDKTGDYWGIRYAELTVPLIKAVQETNSLMKEENDALKSRVEVLEAALAKLQQPPAGIVTGDKPATAQLFQNQPNPFKQSTIIQYSLGTTDTHASIVIRNLNGATIKQVPVSQPGRGQVTINANELAAGTYTYSLIVNDVAVDTKLMVMVR